MYVYVRLRCTFDGLKCTFDVRLWPFLALRPLSLYLLNIRGMFLKNLIAKITPFLYPGCLQSVYDALRKMAHNIKKCAQYCINADGGHFEHLL